MCDEINELVRTSTFELVPPDAMQNIVGTKWIFTLKYLPDGTLDRYKARFVAKRFHQQQGQDYTEAFFPVITSTTVRSVLHVAVSKSWRIRQLDVNNAFLQRTLNEEVYVAQPPGFVDKDHPNHVRRLKKALYRLKQAPRAWYQELCTYLLALGFSNSVADTSLFIHRRGKDIIYVLGYVDEMLITGSNNDLITQFISSLQVDSQLKTLVNCDTSWELKPHEPLLVSTLCKRNISLICSPKPG